MLIGIIKDKSVNHSLASYISQKLDLREYEGQTFDGVNIFYEVYTMAGDKIGPFFKHRFRIVSNTTKYMKIRTIRCL